jgi:hypothetical protein
VGHGGVGEVDRWQIYRGSGFGKAKCLGHRKCQIPDRRNSDRDAKGQRNPDNRVKGSIDFPIEEREIP